MKAKTAPELPPELQKTAYIPRLDTDMLLTKGMEIPAVVLDQTVERSSALIKAVPQNPGIQRAKNYWHSLGPGLTTGASDDDPSGIATYSQAGAVHGQKSTLSPP